MKAVQYAGNRAFHVVSGTALTPGADEVRLEVKFVGICGTDLHIYHGEMDQRIGPPQVIGHESSCVVAEVGTEVDGFRPGDRVVVRPLDYCGACPACNAGCSHICHNLNFMGIDSPGAMQNSWTVKARTLHRLPDNVSLKQGAMIEPLSVACHDVARSRLAPGEKAVVLGGGPIGQLIAQVAEALGAEVLISEPSDVRREFARRVGHRTIDPGSQDVRKAVADWTDGKGADVVFEVAGVPATVEIMTEVASVRGRICVVAIHGGSQQVNLFQFFWKELEMVGARVYEAADFERAIDLVAKGKIDVDPFITSIDPLPDAANAFVSLDGNPSGMKALIECGSDAP